MQMLIIGLAVGVAFMGVLDFYILRQVWKDKLRQYDEFVKRERGK